MKLTTCAIWVLWSMAAVLPARLAAESGGYLMIVAPHEQAITGESTDAKHRGWIRVENVFFSAAGRSSVGQSMGKVSTGGGTETVRDSRSVTIVKQVDQASPKLRKASVTGEPLPKVVIDIPSGDNKHGHRYELQGAVISSIRERTTGSSKSPVEEVTFKAPTISEQTY